MNSSFFRVLLIASCIFALVAESKAETKTLSQAEVDGYYTRFYYNIPKMKSYDNLKVSITELKKKFDNLKANSPIDESIITDINNTLIEVEKKKQKSLQIFKSDEFNVWEAVIDKTGSALKPENISFGFDYIRSQFATVLNETNIRKIDECPKSGKKKLEDYNSTLTQIGNYINNTASLTKSNLQSVNAVLKELLDFIYNEEVIKCQPNKSLSDNGKKLLELVQPIAKNAVVTAWKNVVTIGVAVVGTLSTLTLLAIRSMIGASE